MNQSSTDGDVVQSTSEIPNNHDAMLHFAAAVNSFTPVNREYKHRAQETRAVKKQLDNDIGPEGPKVTLNGPHSDLESNSREKHEAEWLEPIRKYL